MNTGASALFVAFRCARSTPVMNRCCLHPNTNHWVLVYRRPDATAGGREDSDKESRLDSETKRKASVVPLSANASMANMNVNASTLSLQPESARSIDRQKSSGVPRIGISVGRMV